MELGHELLNDIVGVAGINWEKIQTEKRTTMRVPVARKAIILRSCGKSTAMIRDISTGGMSLLCAKPMHKGEEFIVCLPKRNKQVIHVRCKAVREYCPQTHGTVFLVGAVFMQLLTKTQEVTRDGNPMAEHGPENSGKAA